MTLNYRGFLSRLHIISLLSSVFSLVSWGLNLKATFTDSVCAGVRRLDAFTFNKCKASSSIPTSPHILIPLSTHMQYTQTRVSTWPQAALCPFQSQEHYTQP